MATKATVYKVKLNVSDMDRSYFEEMSVTIAQHPSETAERMMVRLLAFALHASEDLKFTEGVSSEDEPDIWQKSMTDEIEIWIDVGLPDERRIKKACNRAKQVYVYAYGGRPVQPWWDGIGEKVARHENLKVIALPYPATKALGEMADRTMALQCTIQDGQIWLDDSKRNIAVEPELLQG
ncbi:MAG: YaeQ family protein [Nitrospinota bacterium]|nr:YaeQ family protein [Nitrospinota bacterium]